MPVWSLMADSTACRSLACSCGNVATATATTAHNMARCVTCGRADQMLGSTSTTHAMEVATVVSVAVLGRASSALHRRPAHYSRAKLASAR